MWNLPIPNKRPLFTFFKQPRALIRENTVIAILWYKFYHRNVERLCRTYLESMTFCYAPVICKSGSRRSGEVLGRSAVKYFTIIHTVILIQGVWSHHRIAQTIQHIPAKCENKMCFPQARRSCMTGIIKL